MWTNSWESPIFEEILQLVTKDHQLQTKDRDSEETDNADSRNKIKKKHLWLIKMMHLYKKKMGCQKTEHSENIKNSCKLKTWWQK